MLSVSIGPLSLPLDRLLIVISLGVAILVAYLVGRKDKLSADGNLASTFIVGMLVARVSFVIQYWQEYRGDWFAIIDIRDAGFDPWAGVITMLVILLWYLWHQPKKRHSLISGSLAGLLVWSLTTIGLWAISETSQQLPKLIVSELEGDTIDLNAIEQGKPRVINLWATWCPPCRREMPVLEKAQQDMIEVGFVFVNQGEHQAVVKQFLDKESLTLGNVVVDNKAILGQLIGSRALPTTLFVDANGNLIDAHLGELSGASLAAKLKKLMQDKTQQEGK